MDENIDEEYIDEEELDRFFKLTKAFLDAKECKEILNSMKIDSDKLYESIKEVVGEEGFTVLDENENLSETVQRYIISFAIYENGMRRYKAIKKKLSNK